MSAEAMAWALRQTAGGVAPKCLLLALADSADPRGFVVRYDVAWFEAERAKAELSEDDALRALRALCDAGLLAPCIRGGQAGWRLSPATPEDIGA